MASLCRKDFIHADKRIGASLQRSAQCLARGVGLHPSTEEESEISSLCIDHHGIKLDRRFGEDFPARIFPRSEKMCFEGAPPHASVTVQRR